MLSVGIEKPSLSLLSGLVFVITAHVFILIIIITWQVTIVIRTGIGGIVPVKGGIAVTSRSVKKSRVEFQLRARSVSVFGHEHRLKGRTHAGITDLAVLITPVGVIHIVTHKIINLLSGSILRSSLARCGECHECQSVLITELFLGTCVV